jgi:serine/threonine-protein kinase
MGCGRAPMLSEIQQTELTPSELVNAAGRVFAVFDERTQDSGNISYGVEAATGRFFIKTAGSPSATAPVLSYSARVELLRNVISIHERVRHDALVPLRNAIESPVGPLLVFDWIDGELLGTTRERRSDPTTAYVRFRRLPVVEVLAALDGIIDLHRAFAESGYVAVDFYDGSLLYDFAASRIHVIDVDSYHRGTFVNRMGRMFGSTRFMAPEEFELGAEIDGRTTVFTLGRAIFELLTDPLTAEFRGAPAIREVAEHASSLSPSDRYSSVSEFADAWRQIRSFE